MKVDLTLPLSIYPIEIIRKGIKSYATVTRINYSISNGICFLNFMNCRYDKGQTKMNFENYLIDLHNSWEI